MGVLACVASAKGKGKGGGGEKNGRRRLGRSEGKGALATKAC